MKNRGLKGYRGVKQSSSLKHEDLVTRKVVFVQLPKQQPDHTDTEPVGHPFGMSFHVKPRGPHLLAMWKPNCNAACFPNDRS